MATIAIQIYKEDNNGERKYTENVTIKVSKKVMKMKVLKDKDAVKSVMNDIMRAVSFHKKHYAEIEHKLATEE